MKSLHEAFEARLPSRTGSPERPAARRWNARKQLLALEPRMLFDGAAAATADALPHAPADVTPEAALPADRGLLDLRLAPGSAGPAETTGAGRSLLVIDPTVQDWQTLAGAARSGVDVLVLDPNKDGLSQIAAAVGVNHAYAEVHVLSHGAGDGRMQLGTRVIDSASLDGYATDLARIGEGLTADGDILLYGCDIGDAYAGMQFLQAIARATGADVAASVDATGAAALGGNWSLEAQVGRIDSALPITDTGVQRYEHLLAAQPTVTLSAPIVSGVGATASVLLGESFTIDADFSNGGSNTGYGPYVDLFVPAAGADGGASPDGVTITGATYNGVALAQTVITLTPTDIVSGTVAHPLFHNTLGGNLVSLPTGMQAGDKLIVFQLPLSEHSPGQAASRIVISGSLSQNADPGTALRLHARAGFQYGADPLDNPATDPSISGSTVAQDVNPAVYRVFTTYLGPEGETAAGPNYLRGYRIDVDVANGQTLNALDLSSMLPDGEQFQAIVGTPASIDGTPIGASPTGSWTNVGGVLVSQAATDVSTPAPSPGGTVTREIATLAGTGASTEASMVVQFYVAQLYGAGGPVVDTSSGAPVNLVAGTSVGGTWHPSDVRDTDLSLVATDSAAATVSAEAVSIQESRVITTDTGAAGFSPGDVVQYTLNIQVSDYFALGGNPAGTDLVVSDTLTDGLQILDATTTPLAVNPSLVVVRAGGAPETYALVPGVNYTVTVDPNGAQVIAFNLRSALPAPGGGQLLVGDLFADGTQSGATTAQVVFNAQVLDTYRLGAPTINGVPQATSPTGRPVEGDRVANDATIAGTVLDGSLDPSVPGLQATSDSTQLIDTMAARAVLFIVDTSQSDTAGTSVAPGEIIRYRMVVQIPEGPLNGLQLVPVLQGGADPSQGLHILNDGTITAALVSNGGLASSTLAGGGLAVAGGGYMATDINAIIPTFVLPSSAIVDPGSGVPLASGMLSSGANAAFRLGNLTNTDGDANAEFIVVEFNAVLNNGVGNVAGATYDAYFTYEVGAPTVDMSNVTRVTVVEPAIASVDKHVVAVSGNQVTFEVTFTNTGTENAQDVRILDDFAGASNISFNGSASITGLPAGATDLSTGTALDVRVPLLAVGGSVTIRYVGTVTDGTQAVPAFPVVVTYTSLSEGPTGGKTLTVSTDSGPTASTTTGERTGNPADYGGAMNTYRVTDPAALGTISGRLWDDTQARNGTMDTTPAENQLGNVLVTLTWAGLDNTFGTGDDAVFTQTTSTTPGSVGTYAFGGLAPGNYRVDVPTGRNALGVGTPLVDPVSGSVSVVFDAAGGTMTDGRIAVTLAEGGAVTGRDFGYVEINQAPVVTVPGAQGAVEGAPLAFTGGASITVGDVDANRWTVTTNNVATLGVSHGTLSATAAGSALVAGSGTASMTITGSLADINATLASLTYLSTPLYQGADTLTVRIDDHGNTGDADGDGIPSQPADNLSDQKTVSITVAGVDHPPVANNDARATDPVTTVTGQAISPNGTQQAAGDATDTDPDLGTGDVLSVQGVRAGTLAGPLNTGVGVAQAGGYGTLTLNSDGTYSYVPGPAAQALQGGVVVTDVFTYTIRDLFGATSTATVTITITGLNQPPLAVADARSTTTDAGAPLAGNVVTAAAVGDHTDTDPNVGDVLTVQGVQHGPVGGVLLGSVGTPIAGTYGTLQLQGDGTYTYALDAANPTVATLLSTQTLTDVFTYTINDGHGGTSTTTLTITITGPERPPDGADKTFHVNEGTPQPLRAVDFGFTDPDPTSTFAAVRIDTLPPSGTLTLNGQPVTAGQLIAVGDLTGLQYLPAPLANSENLPAPPSFNFSVQDNTGRFDPVPNTFTFLIDPVNDPPVAPSIVRTIPADAQPGSDAAKIIGMPAPTDPDLPAQTLTVTITSLPPVVNGSFRLPDGSLVQVGQTLTVTQLQNLSFVPVAGFKAPVDPQGLMPAGTLAYQVDDGHGGTANGEIRINIAPANTPPAPPPAPPLPPEVPKSPNPDPVPPVNVVPPVSQIVAEVRHAVESRLPPILTPRTDFDPFTPWALNTFSPIRAVSDDTSRADQPSDARKGSNVRGVADCQPDEKVHVKVKAKPKLVKRSVLGDVAAQKLGEPTKNFSEQLKLAKKRFKPPVKLPPKTEPANDC